MKTQLTNPAAHKDQTAQEELDLGQSTGYGRAGLLLVGLFAMILAACGGESTESSDATDDELAFTVDEDTEVTVSDETDRRLTPLDENDTRSLRSMPTLRCRQRFRQRCRNRQLRQQREVALTRSPRLLCHPAVIRMESTKAGSAIWDLINSWYLESWLLRLPLRELHR